VAVDHPRRSAPGIGHRTKGKENRDMGKSLPVRVDSVIRSWPLEEAKAKGQENDHTAKTCASLNLVKQLAREWVKCQENEERKVVRNNPCEGELDLPPLGSEIKDNARNAQGHRCRLREDLTRE